MTDFRYYNRNPNKDVKSDCVCKAISTATGLLYAAVDNLLELTAEYNDCDKLCVCCYNKLLSDILCYRRFDCDYEYTVSEIAKMYPRNKLIIRVEGHLTSSVYGVTLDIWDCSNEFVDCYWVIE